MKEVVIIGAGFGGMNAAKALGHHKQMRVTLIDERNYHLFLPLLYQVAVGALSPDDISVPVREVFSKNPNVTVLKEKVDSVDLGHRQVAIGERRVPYDYLIMACGARHGYFGHDEWEELAPGLKTLEQAVEIRDRILNAFERAEAAADEDTKKNLLKFVVVGGGPTGVELSGAIAEMAHVVLKRDFRNIDPRTTKVILVEAGSRILPFFAESSSQRAMRDLKALGVDVRTSLAVTRVDARGVEAGGGMIEAGTVIWAAGVRAAGLNRFLGMELDRQGRVTVEPDLSIKDHPEVFVIGDQANCPDCRTLKPLGGFASVAVQQGVFAARNILRDVRGLSRGQFVYFDRGQAATIGQGRAVVEVGKLKIHGFPAWIIWLVIHLWFLMGIANRMSIVLKWLWIYIAHHYGARIILARDWEFYPKEE